MVAFYPVTLFTLMAEQLGHFGFSSDLDQIARLKRLQQSGFYTVINWSNIIQPDVHGHRVPFHVVCNIISRTVNW